jgi:hypothetical protein
MSRTLVDIPNPLDIEGPWVMIKDFGDREAAITYLQDVLGADENGCICLITELHEEEEDEE